jgi:NAD(P)-dependent dehydrogenase (short-subunit alcohol dehydrogenase family)
LSTDTRIVLITGAASGIGAALARRLGGGNTRLALHTRANAERLEEVAAVAKAGGSEVATLLGDLADAGTAARLIAETEAAFGGLDAVVSNAGYADWQTIEEISEADFEASHQAVTGALFRVTQAALPLLKRSPRGRIVATSTFLAHVFRLKGRHAPASAAAKAGLEGLAKSLAAQLAPDNVTVNCIVPGFIRKDAGTHSSLKAGGWDEALSLIPLGRLGLPDEVAATIAFLLSEEAAYITGQLIHVDGGLTL